MTTIAATRLNQSSSQFTAPPGKPRGTASKPFHSNPFPSHFRFSPTGTSQSLSRFNPDCGRWTALAERLAAGQELPRSLLLTCEKVALTPPEAGLPCRCRCGRAQKEGSLLPKCRGPPFPQRQAPSAPGHRHGHDWSRQDGPQIGRADFPPSGFVVSVLCRGWTPLGGLDCAEKKPSSMPPFPTRRGNWG